MSTNSSVPIFFEVIRNQSGELKQIKTNFHKFSIRTEVMDVIELLSDSDDSDGFNKLNSPPKVVKPNISAMNSIDAARPAHYISDDDMEFPEVLFAEEARRLALNRAAAEPQLQRSNSKIEEIMKKYFAEQPVAEPAPARAPKNKTGLTSADKEALKTQKSKNAEDAAKKKAEKAANAERLKTMKPGECMKYMKVVMDSDLQNFDFFDNLVTQLQGLELEYYMKPQIVPNSITWMRTTQEYLNPGQESLASYENQIIIVWDYSDAVRKVADRTFVSSIASIKDLAHGKVATLIIYGVENYFRHHKNLKKAHIKNQCQGNMKDLTKRKGNKAFQDLPVVSSKEFELCLTEVQLRTNCSSQLIETPEHLGAVISQYTKAIAEAPYKIQKKKAMQGPLEWYSPGDNKDSVKVDKSGNGLKRLWQQQLCQFNLAKLETAEAIISQYPTPRHLMEVRSFLGFPDTEGFMFLLLFQAYAFCTPLEGAKMLQDIAVSLFTFALVLLSIHDSFLFINRSEERRDHSLR